MRSSWRPVLVFCLLAFGLSWLICLPLWLGGGLASPLFMVCSLAMMATPGISALIVVGFIEKRPIASTLGLRPRTGAVSTLIWLAIAFVAVVLVGSRRCRPVPPSASTPSTWPACRASARSTRRSWTPRA